MFIHKIRGDAMTNRRLLQLFGVLIVGLFVFSFLRGTLAGGPTPDAVSQPGSQGVYQRIAGLTDCTAIQAEFDQAYADHEAAPAGSQGREWTVGYMSAAQDRMKALGCT
jgi:hypothetical protein